MRNVQNETPLQMVCSPTDMDLSPPVCRSMPLAGELWLCLKYDLPGVDQLTFCNDTRILGGLGIPFTAVIFAYCTQCTSARKSTDNDRLAGSSHSWNLAGCQLTAGSRQSSDPEVSTVTPPLGPLLWYLSLPALWLFAHVDRGFLGASVARSRRHF